MKLGRRGWLRIGWASLPIAFVAVGVPLYMTSMPGRSFSGALLPLSAEESQIKANLNQHVNYLAGAIGERNVIAYEPLQKTAQYIEDDFKKLGYTVQSQEYVVQMRRCGTSSRKFAVAPARMRSS